MMRYETMSIDELIRIADNEENELAKAIYAALVEEGKELLFNINEEIQESFDNGEIDWETGVTTLQEHFQPDDLAVGILCCIDDAVDLTPEQREKALEATKKKLKRERDSFDHAIKCVVPTEFSLLAASNVVKIHDHISTSSFGDILDEENLSQFDKTGKK